MSSGIDTLRQLLASKSVRSGDFTLASGKHSTIYVDARLTTMSPEGMVLIGSLALEQMNTEGWKPDSVGGLTLGADPVAFAISHTSADTPVPVRAFTVRKEQKTHGTGSLIEGPFKSGDQVVIVEDVITTGKSALSAIRSIENAGGQVLGVLAVVDREDGGCQTLEALGYRVVSLTKLRDLTSPIV